MLFTRTRIATVLDSRLRKPRVFFSALSASFQNETGNLLIVMFPFLSRYVLFPLHQRLTDRSTLSALDRLRESQRWTSERLQNWQEESLARLLAHASRNVPYYRDLFTREGLDPEFAARNGWARIPLMGKEIVREQFARLQGPAGPRRFFTGSSTGPPGHPLTRPV